MVAYLVEMLKAGGVPEADISTLDEEGERAMIVRLPGGKQGRPVLFSAHMDVVDARPEEWERDPFKLIEEKGNFYGRGTSDNKAGVAALVSTILRFKAGQMKPSRDLVFAFVGDEETSMNTTRLIAAHPWVKDAEFAINTDAGGGILDDTTGKPLIYLVQGAEKTYATFDVVVTNPGGHSSRPRADNAIYQLAHALEKVEAYRFPTRMTTRKVASGRSRCGALRWQHRLHPTSMLSVGRWASTAPPSRALRCRPWRRLGETVYEESVIPPSTPTVIGARG